MPVLVVPVSSLRRQATGLALCGKGPPLILTLAELDDGAIAVGASAARQVGRGAPGGFSVIEVSVAGRCGESSVLLRLLRVDTSSLEGDSVPADWSCLAWRGVCWGGRVRGRSVFWRAHHSNSGCLV